MPAGRPPMGPRLVNSMKGTRAARRRLRVILETIAGERTVQNACAELRVGEPRFFELRRMALEAALARLEPAPIGRPPKPLLFGDAAIAAVHAEVKRLRREVRAHLDAADARMAHDGARNREALTWSEDTTGDVAGEPP